MKTDRLHNMRTMEYQTPEKQKQKSFETLEIYAPIAHRLGMQKMKWELEDLSLKYLDPISYREIVDALNEKAAEYDGFMSSIHDQITQRLHESNIDGYVYGRMKHPYSIYRKMYTQNKSLDDVYDLFAFRVIVDTVSDCYYVLGIIHDLYKPVLGRFKDYIGTPKPNMYQSLHTTVMGQNGIPFEVQIRTKEMHEVAEYGIAAHWKYKQNGQGGGDEGRYEWVRRLLENQEGTDAEEFIHSLKVDMFADEVFVFTPRGDVINLPAGATPIDFAYNIHSAVGNHMVAAKVNGRIVPFDFRLKNGDIVEVVTSQSAHGPSRDWVKIARSRNARSWETSRKPRRLWLRYWASNSRPSSSRWSVGSSSMGQLPSSRNRADRSTRVCSPPLRVEKVRSSTSSSSPSRDSSRTSCHSSASGEISRSTWDTGTSVSRTAQGNRRQARPPVRICPRYSSPPSRRRSRVVFPLPFRPTSPSFQSVSSCRSRSSKTGSLPPS